MQSPFAAPAGGVRFLNLHEYQGKDLLESYGASVQPGKMATNPTEAFEIATRLQAESACLLLCEAVCSVPRLPHVLTVWVFVVQIPVLLLW